jgi:hypothetical protein
MKYNTVVHMQQAIRAAISNPDDYIADTLVINQLHVCTDKIVISIDYDTSAMKCKSDIESDEWQAEYSCLGFEHEFWTFIFPVEQGECERIRSIRDEHGRKVFVDISNMR